MKIRPGQPVRSEFVISAYSPRDFPQDMLPEVAFAGRSNVGKSSLINCLLERKNLAKTSSTPGKTRGINFYLIERKLYFVDLPGYGFARVPHYIRKHWRLLIEPYLTKNLKLKGVVLIIDSRLEATESDRIMIRWLKSFGIPFVVVATKVDKLSGSERSRCFERLQQAYREEGVQEILPFSARTKEGRKPLWRIIQQLVEGAYEERAVVYPRPHAGAGGRAKAHG